MNLPNRVPVLAKPQEGSSMVKPSRALCASSACLSLSMGCPASHVIACAHATRAALPPVARGGHMDTRRQPRSYGLEGTRLRSCRGFAGPLGHRRGSVTMSRVCWTLPSHEGDRVVIARNPFQLLASRVPRRQVLSGANSLASSAMVGREGGGGQALALPVTADATEWIA